MLRMHLHKLIRRYEAILFIVPALAVLVAVVIYPLIYAMAVAFFEVAVPALDNFVGLNNFRSILGDQKYGKTLITTLVYVFGTVSGSFVLGFGVALLLRGITWGKSLLRVVLIVPMMVAPLVVGLTWRWMLNPTQGAVNWIFGLVHLPGQTWLAQRGASLAGVILVDIWEWYPLVFLIIYAGLSALPRELYDAAAVDGASAWMTFRRITLPMLRPVILVALLLRTTDAFRTFDIVKAMTGGGPGASTELLSLYLWRLAFKFNKLTEAAAGAIIMLLIVGAIFVIMFRFLYTEVGTRREGR